MEQIATVSRPLTGSEDEAVKLKRPCMRRPCSIASDDKLRLLLPVARCRAANTLAISASSSCREVGCHQHGSALKTPGSSNRASAACACFRPVEVCSRRGSSSSTTRRSILTALANIATLWCAPAGLLVPMSMFHCRSRVNVLHARHLQQDSKKLRQGGAWSLVQHLVVPVGIDQREQDFCRARLSVGLIQRIIGLC